ncbi:MAG: hypothetical protein K8Q89_05610 [Nitrosarchaeum sp.]|nr:hypothetical protein [Nitrosarchaeum sp.]
MKTRLLIILGLATAVVTSAFILNEMFDPVFSENPSLLGTCNLIHGENNTFYVSEDCKMEAFKPIRPSATFWSMELNQKIHEAAKIRNACIPVSGFDVDDIKGVLTIYLTKENELKYKEDIDKIIEIPYVIKTTDRLPSGTFNPLRDAGCFIETILDD